MGKRLYLESCYIQCKNGKNLGSAIENSVITCDEIIDAEAKLYNKKVKQRNKF